VIVLASNGAARVNQGSLVVIAAFTSSLPLSTSAIAAAATIILLIDPTRKSVDVVTASGWSWRFLPTPAANMSLPCRTMATLAPGTPPAASSWFTSPRNFWKAAVSSGVGCSFESARVSWVRASGTRGPISALCQCRRSVCQCHYRTQTAQVFLKGPGLMCSSLDVQTCD